MGSNITKYTKQRADEICEWISKGETLAEWCRQNNIGRTTVYAWKDEHPDFAERFARARELGEEVIAESCLKIADDGSNDWIETFGDESAIKAYAYNGEHVQRSKLRVETRLKLLAKFNPKRWGEKISNELTGANGAPLTVVVQKFTDDDDDDDQTA